MAGVIVKLQAIKDTLVGVPRCRIKATAARCLAHKSPEATSPQKRRPSMRRHTDLASPIRQKAIASKQVNFHCYKWQKKETKFSDHSCKQDTTTYHDGNSHSLSMDEHNAVLYSQGITSTAYYSDSAQNHPKEKEICNNERVGFLSPNASPLLFFYDCESTGANVHEDHIIEIAAEVVGSSAQYVNVKSFSELCSTPYPIWGVGCGVTDDMLIDKREFSDVFPDFLSWINWCTKEVKRATAKPFYPVLVAHNGFVFDFRILAAEVERHNLRMKFNRADLGFSDTLFELRKMRKACDPILSDWSPQEQRRLSMSNLHKKYFPGQNHLSTHRALEDVQMMIRIFTTSKLSKVLQSLTMRSTSEIISDWKKIHKTYTDRNMM